MVLTNELILKLGPPLYRFFLARFGKLAAEDLVQEVFSRIASSRTFIGGSKPEAFAWGIALNLQKETRRAALRTPDSIEDYEKLEHVSSELDQFRDLRSAIQKLSLNESEVMQLVLADLGISEIAEYLRIPEGTVKSHIHRAKENLKILLTKDLVNEKR